MTGFNVQGLTKRFGANTVVDDLDLTVEDGEFVPVDPSHEHRIEPP